MARIAVAAALLLSGMTTHAAWADTEPDEQTQAAADEAGVDARDLLGAMNTTGLDAQTYLTAVGELPVTSSGAAPALACGWPICGPLGTRLYCIEGAESHHNGAAVNPSSGAAGWLQWLPGTARRWGVQIGNRWSEWQGAAAIAALGDRFFWSQWTTLQMGLC